jgi:hypothetical protein
MTMAHPLLRQHPRPVRTFVRCLWILGLSALLHLFVINWSTGAICFPALHPADNAAVITTRLLAPPAPQAVAAAPAAPPRPQRKRPPRPAAAPVTQAMPAGEPAMTGTAAARGIDASDLAAAKAAVAAAMQSAAVPEAPEPTESGGKHYKISLPPSAELKYDVQKTSQNNQPMYGHGTISWQTDGRNYRIDGDAGVLFFTVLTFKSEGSVDDNGIAPELYSEKRFRKSEVDTHFHRQRNTISFSSSTRSYARTGVEQDRASVIWQLAGIGRGGEKFAPGAEIDLIVAGTRDMDMWRMQIVGEEEITIGDDSTRAWHVTRIPRPGSHDQKLDIWLAPQQNWYPVRLRYTESNGDYLDMSLTGLNVPATP